MQRAIRAGVVALLSVTAIGLLAPVRANEIVKGDGGKVRLLYNEPGTNSFIPFTIKKFALDKKHGFELVTVPTTTTQASMIAIQSGAADLGTFGWNEVGRMIHHGIDVVGVAPFLRWGADFYVVAADSPIKTLADLKGKKIGTGSKTALNYIILRSVAKKNYNLDVEKDATIHEGAPNLLRALMEQGQIDAGGMFNSVTPAMIATGRFRVLTKISDLVNQFGLPDTPFLLYAADAKWVASKPQNVKAFVAAYQDAVQILRTNDEVWLERGKQLKFTDEVSALFRTEARTDIWLKFEPDTEARIRKIFDTFLPIAGAEALGLSTLPAGFMTLEYQ